MSLAAHGLCLERGDVEDGAVGGAEGVEGAAEGGFGEFFGEVGDVERLVWGGRGGGGGCYCGHCGCVVVVVRIGEEVRGS